MQLVSVATIALGMMLAGCQDKVAKAEARLAFLEENGGSLGDVCAASRDVEQATAEAQDADRYRSAKVTAGINCQRADLLGASMPANEQDAAYNLEPDNLDTIEDTTR